ncbi:MAG: methyltransferase domain-containing protein [Myxococcota bacterium]
MSRGLDAERLRDFSRLLFGHLNGAVTSALVYLGDELGLYRALAEKGPASSHELAERTGLDERWVREWLYNQGAAGLLEAQAEERFALTPEARAVLAEEAHPAFGAGMFSQLPKTLGAVEQLRESFRTGIGLPYDAFGPEGARGVERGFAPWVRSFLVPAVIRRVPGLVERLEGGARVADVGCGAGVALVVLAEAFPKAELHGYELSRHALERAEENRSRAGASNLAFHDVSHEPLPDDERFDLVLSFDCLHDMTDPEGVARSIRGAVRPDGVWLIADIKSHPSYAENVAQNPMASLMYGFSVLTCMSSALSEPGGAGLGTLGLPEAHAKGLAERAGFTRFLRLDIDHPINAFYEARP